MQIKTAVVALAIASARVSQASPIEAGPAPRDGSTVARGDSTPRGGSSGGTGQRGGYQGGGGIKHPVKPVEWKKEGTEAEWKKLAETLEDKIEKGAELIEKVIEKKKKKPIDGGIKKK